MGLLLLGKGNGEFFEVPTQQSKFIASKDVKNMSLIKTTNGFSVLIANNNDGLQIFKINTNIK
jgi:hypothetical protein